MEDAVRYSCDASFEHPSALVFDGLLYERTLTPANYLQGATIARVIPYGQNRHKGHEDDEDVPTENGPELVVFHRFVYARTDTDSANIDDDILRTVAFTTLPKPLRRMQTRQSQAENPVYVGPQQSNNFVHYEYTRVMPQRAIITQESVLEPLFDLAANERAGAIYIVPSKNNVLAPTTPGMIAVPAQGRTHWKDEHVNYLHELMELAMLKMNRPLEHADFPAITEALHRYFRVNGGIVERGFNTVHSFATRKPAYHELVQSVLPDIGFPDFVPKTCAPQQ